MDWLDKWSKRIGWPVVFVGGLLALWWLIQMVTVMSTEVL